MKLSPEQQGRAATSLKKIGIVLAAGFAYYLFVRVSGWGIPCIFYVMSGLYCPGCGITRMCMALLRLDFAGAFRANALIMALLPAGAFFGIRRWVIYVKTGEEDMDLPEKIAVFAAFLLAVTFWIIRNLPQFAFLAPRG